MRNGKYRKVSKYLEMENNKEQCYRNCLNMDASMAF